MTSKPVHARNTKGGDRPRVLGDVYPTPGSLAAAIVRRVKQTIGSIDLLIEPSAGDGTFVRACRDEWGDSLQIHAVEPRVDALVHRLKDPTTSTERTTWETSTRSASLLSEHERALIIGNPPFLLAEKHVRVALDRLGHKETFTPQDRYLAFLLRSSFLAGDKRSRGLHIGIGGLRYVWNIVGRPSFTGDGRTDGAEYACLIWQVGWSGPYEGDWLIWKDTGESGRSS